MLYQFNTDDDPHENNYAVFIINRSRVEKCFFSVLCTSQKNNNDNNILVVW